MRVAGGRTFAGCTGSSTGFFGQALNTLVGRNLDRDDLKAAEAHIDGIVTVS